MTQLNINTDAVIKFTNTLEKLHRSALPSAIRGTLNKAVFDVKTNTMPKTADQTFQKRQPNFFKANSRFENATGFNVNQMKASVGFVEGGLRGGNNFAVKDLEEQEHGGGIDKKSFIPLKGARVGNNPAKNVRANARLSAIKKIVDVRKMIGKSKKEKFVQAALEAGRGGFVLSGKTLWKINSFKRGKSGINKTPLYSFKKGRKVRVTGTSFMQKSSLESANKLEQYYVIEAQRQIEKFIK